MSVAIRSVVSPMKTVPTDASVTDFIDAVENDRRREDGRAMLAMMERLTGEKAVMWGPSIVGFGQYHYKYDSGHEGDSFLTGFSPRKANLAVYIMPGFSEQSDLMARLGKHRTGRSCLYINKLDDVDLGVLGDLIVRSVAWMRNKYSA